MKYGLVTAALVTALSGAATPVKAMAQSECSRPDDRPENVDIRVVGNWFLELSIWPSKRFFNVEMRPVRPTNEQGLKPAISCFDSEPLADAPAVSAVQFQIADFSGGSLLKIRIFWADQNQGEFQGKAGDIVAAQCSSADLQTQTRKCNAWRKLGGWYKLIGNWPPDWR